MSEQKTCEELKKKVLELEGVEMQLKRTEQLLSDEINWRRLIIAESRDAIVVIDQETNVYEANKRFADMLGYSLEELYKLHAWE